MGLACFGLIAIFFGGTVLFLFIFFSLEEVVIEGFRGKCKKNHFFLHLGLVDWEKCCNFALPNGKRGRKLRVEWGVR